MRVVGTIVGFLIAVLGLPFLLIGIGITGFVKDLSPLAVPLRGFAPPPRIVAVVSPEFSANPDDLPSQVRDATVTIRIRPAEGTGPVFVGLAQARDLRRYLRRVPVGVLQPRETPTTGNEGQGDGPPDPQVLIRDRELEVTFDVEHPNAKGRRVRPPARQDFWIRQATADGDTDFTVGVDDLRGEAVRVAVLRADGRAGIAADAELRFRLPFLKTIGWWVLGISLLVVLGGLALAIGLLMRGGQRKTGGPPADAPPDADAPAVDGGPTAAG